MSDSLLESSRGKPKCIAIIICNEIIEDKQTSNKTLVSLFNSILVQAIPGSHARMFLLASFADGEGEWPISISIRSPQGKELLRAENVSVFSDPTAVMDIVIEVRGLPLESEGAYFVDVAVDNSVLAYRRFTVNMANSA